MSAARGEGRWDWCIRRSGVLLDVASPPEAPMPRILECSPHERRPRPIQEAVRPARIFRAPASAAALTGEPTTIRPAAVGGRGRSRTSGHGTVRDGLLPTCPPVG